MTHHASRRRVVPPASNRARRSFWLLVAVAVLAAGALTSALSAAPGPITGLRVAASGVLLVAALTLATRVMVALERTRRRARAGQTPTGHRDLDVTLTSRGMAQFRAMMWWCSTDPGRERGPTLTKSSWFHCRGNIIVNLGSKYPKGVTDPVLSVAISGWRGRLWQPKSAPRGLTMVTAMYVVEGLTRGSCLAQLLENVRSLEGVTDVTMDLVWGGQSPLVVTSTAKLALEAVRASVESAGFDLIVAGGRDVRARRERPCIQGDDTHPDRRHMMSSIGGASS